MLSNTVNKILLIGKHTDTMAGLLFSTEPSYELFLSISCVSFTYTMYKTCSFNLSGCMLKAIGIPKITFLLSGHQLLHSVSALLNSVNKGTSPNPS